MRFKWTMIWLIGICFVWGEAQASSLVRDSLRVESQEGIQYIIHKVDAGETVYGLTRRYKVTKDDLIKANPTVAQGLMVNQLLRIPLPQQTQVTQSNSVHTVGPGETLYRISQKYDVDVEDIKKWNNLTSNSLSIGQELVINGAGTAAEPTTRPQNLYPAPENGTENTTTVAGSGTHVVQPDETLYAISRKYGITVADIRIWNSLPNNDIGVGQTIRIKAPEEGNETTSPVTHTDTQIVSTPTTTPEDNNTNNTDNTSTTTTETPTQVVTTPSTGMPTRVSESVRTLSEGDEENSTGYTKVQEKGLCEVIEGSSDTKKYLAMHSSAPIGTIMEVRNEMNDLKVFVRVVARLPQTTNNEQLVLKISNAAYERLGAVDRRFPIEVTYIP